MAKSPSLEKPEFDIQPKVGKALLTFLYSQFFITPPYPTKSFAGQTIIVTGANVGLGLETARHFYRLGSTRLILAVRTISKGEEAKGEIVRSVPSRTDGASAIEVWQLDLSSTQSTLGFTDRVRAELPRVDVVVENAGINQLNWVMTEGYESSVQVNVLNTFLLALDLLPKLSETKTKFPESSPHLVVVSSEAHHLTKFKEVNAPDIYERLNKKAQWNDVERYQITKLMEVLFVRELVARRAKTQNSGPNPVIINLVNPGLCESNIDRTGKSPGLVIRLLRPILFRTTEVGGRAMVLGASASEESHGEFMSDGIRQAVEGWIEENVGRRAQHKVFEQTIVILEERKPGVAAAAGL
ncbi:Retinol dehydrogenase 11 [Colletotrichum musicola]|uniref:Retinol dehydrogenase 11 n=1 Tax=Colletotrichum musicola TaxID=2175873 RepID=A0A8H6K2A2_9PEZI|nr:Retinol dehydrogenase 11 [Colletotrichum musicola]